MRHGLGYTDAGNKADSAFLVIANTADCHFLVQALYFKFYVHYLISHNNLLR